jgi:hypothetical protein
MSAGSSCRVKDSDGTISNDKTSEYPLMQPILFFVYFGTHNNKIHTIYKQTRVFVFIFSMLLFCFY